MAVMVTEEDFMNAERELVPSVSFKELEHYKMVRAQFEKPAEEKKPAPHQNGKGNEKTIAIDGIPEASPPRPRSNGKGKGKAVDIKGKGKAVASWDVNGSDNDDEEDGMFYAERVNGLSIRSKGKGKGIDMEFQEGHVDDDEGLY